MEHMQAWQLPHLLLVTVLGETYATLLPKTQIMEIKHSACRSWKTRIACTDVELTWFSFATPSAVGLTSLNRQRGSLAIWSSDAPRSVEAKLMLYPMRLLMKGTQQQSSRKSRNGKE